MHAWRYFMGVCLLLAVHNAVFSATLVGRDGADADAAPLTKADMADMYTPFRMAFIEAGAGYASTYFDSATAEAADAFLGVNISMGFGKRAAFSSFTRLQYQYVDAGDGGGANALSGQVGVGVSFKLTKANVYAWGQAGGQGGAKDTPWMSSLAIYPASFSYGGNLDVEAFEGVFWQYRLPVQLRLWKQTDRHTGFGFFVEGAYTLTMPITGEIDDDTASGFEVNAGINLVLF